MSIAACPHGMPVPAEPPRRLLAGLILDRPSVVLAVVAVLTALAAWSLTGVRIGVSPFETILASDAEHDAYRELVGHYGGSSDDLVYVGTREGASLFTVDTLDAVRAASAALTLLENVTAVASLTSALRQEEALQGSEGLFSGDVRRPYWPEFADDRQTLDLDSLRDEMLSDPGVTGVYLSEEGTVQLMVLTVERALELSPGEQRELRDGIRSTLVDHGLGEDGVHLAGLLPVAAWTFEALFVCVFVLFPISIVVVGLLVYVRFRRVRIALLAVGIALVALVWSFGVTQWIFGSINVLVAAVPGIVMTIASADVVHLVSAFSRGLRSGQSRSAAVRAAVHEVGEACVLTSVTTFAGFLSLLVIPALAIRQLAVAASVGVAGALLLAVTVVPIVLSRMRSEGRPRRPDPRVDAALAIGADASWRIGSRNPARVVWIFFLLLLLSATIASRLSFEPDLPRRFAPGHPLRKAVTFFEELGGSSSFDLLLAGENGAFLEPDVLDSLAQGLREAEALPGVSSTTSIIDVFEESADAGGMDTSPIPRSTGAAASRLWTLERIAGKDLSPILSTDRDRTRAVIRLHGSRLREGRRTTEQVALVLRDSLPDSIDIETAGFVPLVGRFLDEAVEGQLEGLAICYVAVTLVLSIAARSFRVGLLTSLPNLLPLAMLGALIHLTLDPADSDLIMIGTVTLCLSVDNAIHLVHRYRVELAGAGSPEIALERTLHSTGGAIIFTTFALCLGFGAFGFSRYLTSWIFGSYLLFGLIVGMAANLLVLPALVRLGWLRPKPLIELDGDA